MKLCHLYEDWFKCQPSSSLRASFMGNIPFALVWGYSILFYFHALEEHHKWYTHVWVTFLEFLKSFRFPEAKFLGQRTEHFYYHQNGLSNCLLMLFMFSNFMGSFQLTPNVYFLHDWIFKETYLPLSLAQCLVHYLFGQALWFKFSSFQSDPVTRKICAGSMRFLQIPWGLLLHFWLHKCGFAYVTWKGYAIMQGKVAHHPWAGCRGSGSLGHNQSARDSDLLDLCIPALALWPCAVL